MDADTVQLDPEIETFLTRFAAGAGSTYRWELSGPALVAYFGRTFRARDLRPEGCIGLNVAEAQAVFEGEITPEVAFWFLPDTPKCGLARHHAWLITRASHEHSTSERLSLMEVVIRKRLLRICGLEEPKS